METKNTWKHNNQKKNTKNEDWDESCDWKVNF